MKKILVTGGAGFIGSHLCQKLINENNQVTCLDNLSSGNFNNISNLMDSKLFEFIKNDICNELPDYKFDEIYNLACPASPKSYQSDPINTLKTSVIGSIKLLEKSKNDNSKILQASTSEVYGDPLIHPQKESYWGNVNPIGLRSCYDEGKRCAESLFMDFNREYNVNVRIIRIFNTYGPKMKPDDGRVVSNFIVQALKNDDITIYGDGLQTRSFQYIYDILDAILLFMRNSTKFTGPINLGNPNEFTILDLANKIIKYTNSKSKLIFLPLPSDDPKVRKPEISLAKKLLGWKPDVSLDNGIKKTIKYFDKILK